MIYVECKPDLTLVKFLTNIKRRDITHEFKGKGEICNRLRKQANCKALLDEDPFGAQPRYMKEAKLVNDLPEHDLKLLHDSANNNYLVVLCPRLEEWVLKAAREAGIDVRKYDLPTDASRLHKEINIRLDKFEKLLEELKDSSNMLKTLKRLLERGQ